MRAYYNEFDPHAAAWLRELIKAGLIMDGDIDERSIADVQPADLAGFQRVHFFAGIAGWDYALQLAGWPDDRPVWTGSCPCQPFSSAGDRKGTKDERHLWPEMFRLIKACRPETVFGEQVASSEVVGTQLEANFIVAVQRGEFARANKLAKRLVASGGFHFHPRWVDGIHADLEAASYTFGSMVLGAHSVGAPHIRQRLFWMANASCKSSQRRTRGFPEKETRVDSSRALDGSLPVRFTDGCEGGRVGHSDSSGSFARRQTATTNGHRSSTVADGGDSRVGYSNGAAQERLRSVCVSLEPKQETGRPGYATAWTEYEFIGCADGKTRRIKPGLEPLANGIPGRVGLLRGYGNAIVAELAAEFIEACEECLNQEPDPC